MGSGSLLQWGGASTKRLVVHRYSVSKPGWTRTFSSSSFREPLPSTFLLISWNVDFDPKFTKSPSKRTEHIISVVREHVQKDGSILYCAVLLQMAQRTILEALLECEWVRRHFVVVPIHHRDWPAHAPYGNITLIAKSLPVSQAVRITFHNSAVARHGLVVDLKLSSSKQDKSKEAKPSKKGTGKVVRLINAELEPLAFGKKTREDQVHLIQGCLRDEGVYGGVAGGEITEGSGEEKSETSQSQGDAQVTAVKATKLEIALGKAVPIKAGRIRLVRMAVTPSKKPRSGTAHSESFCRVEVE